MSARAAIEAELDALAAVGIRPFDVHAHTGVDIDGSARTAAEHAAAVEALGGRSVIFPLCVRGGYAAENRRVVAEARRHPERLVPFARLDPCEPQAAAAAAAALADGARGFKLHPRAEDFRLDDPGVAAIATVAAEAGVPLLVHAGLGVGSFGETVTELARAHRRCPIVLAHAAVSDLVWLGEVAAEHPNLFFDTSWWNPGDLLALFAAVPPGQILFGSDEPYMDLRLVLAVVGRCAAASGLDRDALALVFGGQLERLLDGETAIDAGPAADAAPALSPARARLATLLAALGGALLSGGDPAQLLELARLAVGGDERETLAALLDEVEAASEEAPWALAMAMALVLTPPAQRPALAA